MKSLQHRFNHYKTRHPHHANFTNLMKAVKCQGYKKETLQHWMNILLEKDDFSSHDKKSLIENLLHVTNIPEDTSK